MVDHKDVRPLAVNGFFVVSHKPNACGYPKHVYPASNEKEGDEVQLP